jgi:pyruvate-formate lyase-activating enzyme
MMEEDSCGQLPPEVWSHILTFVDDFRDIIDLKFVNQIFYQELGSKDPFKAFDRSINISKGKSIIFL